jgi:hypothetical protein
MVQKYFSTEMFFLQKIFFGIIFAECYEDFAIGGYKQDRDHIAPLEFDREVRDAVLV